MLLGIICILLCPHLTSSQDPIILTPTDDGFEKASQLWNPAWDGLVPASIFLCTKAEDVVEAVLYAKQTQLKLRVKSGGHHMFGWSVCPDKTCVVADVSKLNHINVDAKEHKMVVGTGAKQREIFQVLTEMQLTMNYASGGSISISSLSLSSEPALEGGSGGGKGGLHFALQAVPRDTG